jgi:histidinol-phosphate aminotransferase
MDPPVRLHRNEFRHPHHNAVVKATQIVNLSEHSDGASTKLLAAIGNYIDVSPPNIIVSTDDEIFRGILILTGKKDLIIGVPTNIQFTHYARLFKMDFHEFALDVQRGASVVSQQSSLLYYKSLMKKGALVYLGSPNDPVGECWPADIIEALATQFPNSFFLIDETHTEEAASYACNTPNSYSIVQKTINFANIFVFRTFSTIFGLAALRIGYGIGHHDILKHLYNIIPNALWPCAENAALATLEHVDYYFKLAIYTAKLHIKIHNKLESKNWNVISGKGHFLMVFCGANQSAFVAHTLAAKNIYVYDRGNHPCLDGYIQISIGTTLDMEDVVNALGASPLERPIQYYYTPKTHISKLKILLRKTLKIIKAPMWLESGTLLGCIRHNGIIPTDNDVTLGYIFDEKEPLNIADFSKIGLTIQQNTYWQIGTSDVHIDIFPYLFINNMYICAYTNHCNPQYSYEELFPLKPARFYDFDVFIPHQALKILGSDYMHTARVSASGKVLEFSLHDYTPA